MTHRHIRQKHRNDQPDNGDVDPNDDYTEEVAVRDKDGKWVNKPKTETPKTENKKDTPSVRVQNPQPIKVQPTKVQPAHVVKVVEPAKTVEVAGYTRSAPINNKNIELTYEERLLQIAKQEQEAKKEIEQSVRKQELYQKKVETLIADKHHLSELRAAEELQENRKSQPQTVCHTCAMCPLCVFKRFVIAMYHYIKWLTNTKVFLGIIITLLICSIIFISYLISMNGIGFEVTVKPNVYKQVPT